MNSRLTQPDGNRAPDAIEVVNELATTIGGRLKNVKSRWLDGSTRTRQLRLEYRGHQVEIVADHESMMFDIEARFGQFTLLYIHPWKEDRWERHPAACTIHAAGAEHAVYTYGNKLSPPQTQLIEGGTLKSLIEQIQLRQEEMMNISQRLVRFDLKKPTAERALTAIEAVIKLMPHESSSSLRSYEDLPRGLQPLVPLIPKWGIADDEERWQKIQRSARSTRQKLTDTVVPLLPAINEYLDTFNGQPLSPDACELGNLAQAALEAQRSLTEGSDNAPGA